MQSSQCFVKQIRIHYLIKILIKLHNVKAPYKHKYFKGLQNIYSGAVQRSTEYAYSWAVLRASTHDVIYTYLIQLDIGICVGFRQTFFTRVGI